MSKQPPQSELRCPQCDYRLTGLTTDACPECGKADVVRAARALWWSGGIRYRRWLHGFAIALVLTTFLLISWGGTVTSKGVGLSVPDAPETFGHNLFMYPPSQWKAGVFWEHTHRLLGSFVGMLSIVMCWALVVTQKKRMWLRWLGVGLLAAVILQGLMGIWRVTEINEYWGIAHGISGQLVLCMTVLVAAALGRTWIERHPQPDTAASAQPENRVARRVRRLSIMLFAAVFIQLTLGATIRHTDAALAIPDFPSNYGGILPPFTQEGIDEARQQFSYDHPAIEKQVTPTDIQHHFSHRVWAIVVCITALWFATKVAVVAGGQRELTLPTLAVLFLLVVQIALGASVIWTAKQYPIIATSHQVVGAAIIALVTLLMIRVRVLPLHEPEPDEPIVTPNMEAAGV